MVEDSGRPKDVVPFFEIVSSGRFHARRSHRFPDSMADGDGMRIYSRTHWSSNMCLLQGSGVGLKKWSAWGLGSGIAPLLSLVNDRRRAL